MLTRISKTSFVPPTYPCTFENCGLTFTRDAWEEHEKTAHTALQFWKCCIGTCKHVSYIKQTHTTHLARKHKITNPADIAANQLESHVGGGSFWCGFCRSAVAPDVMKWIHLAFHFDDGAKFAEYVFA